MPHPNKDKYLNVRIDTDTHNKLKKMAVKDRRSLINLIQLLLEKAVEKDAGR